MAFKPFNFTYTPPPTVDIPSPSTTASQVTTASNVTTPSTAGANSKAGQLITQLNDLVSMSMYLQDAILALTGQSGIEIDPAVDPNTVRALTSIYGTNNPPVVISIAMYDNMLDASLGTRQLQMAVGLNSSIQPNPVQVADLITTTKAVENALVEAPSFNNYLPLQLASLKADSVVLQNWAVSLATYPAFYATPVRTPATLQTSTLQATGLDMSDDQFNSQGEVISAFQQAYANAYESLATPSSTQKCANGILQQLISQPTTTILGINSLLTATQGLIHKTSMSALTGDLINYSFAMLGSDMSGMLTNLDQLTQLGTSPLQGNMGALSKVISAVQQQIATVGVVATGAVAGLSLGSSMVANTTASPLTVPGVGQVCDGVKQLGEIMNWGTDAINNSMSIVHKSFQQLMKRRVGQQNDRQSLMNSQGAMDTITGLVKGILSAKQSGTLSPNSTATQQQDVANNILTSLQTGSNSTFVASGNQVIVNPPTLPPITPAVKNVLSSAHIVSTQGTVQQG